MNNTEWELADGGQVIDSRDVIARIEYLEGLETRDAGEADELEKLTEFANEASAYAPDWEYGVILIHDDFFTEYAKELLIDCGYVRRDMPSWIEIDWEKTAESVRMDYTPITLDGENYWTR